MRFKIDWTSLIVGSKFTVFALFYFVFEGNFPSTSPRGGAYFWRGDLTDGFLRYLFGGIIFGGAYFRNLRYFNCTVEHLYGNLGMPLSDLSSSSKSSHVYHESIRIFLFHAL